MKNVEGGTMREYVSIDEWEGVYSKWANLWQLFFAAHLRQLIESERVDGNTQEKVAWLEEQLEQEIQFQLEEQLDDSDEEMIADL